MVQQKQVPVIPKDGFSWGTEEENRELGHPNWTHVVHDSGFEIRNIWSDRDPGDEDLSYLSYTRGVTTFGFTAWRRGAEGRPGGRMAWRDTRIWHVGNLGMDARQMRRNGSMVRLQGLDLATMQRAAEEIRRAMIYFAGPSEQGMVDNVVVDDPYWNIHLA